MRLEDLLVNQTIIIQLVWGDQTIEFQSDVIEKDEGIVHVTAYIHNGSELQLNITEGAGVICNVFADNSATGQRVSWRNVELTTVDKNGTAMYCIKTRGFNHFANPDDRRQNERTLIYVKGRVADKYNNDTASVTVRDISGVGVAFYAPENYSPSSQQVIVTFTDDIDGKIFEVKVECSISRMNAENGQTLVGCQLVGENRDYQLYRFIKHLREKSGYKASAGDSKNTKAETDVEAEVETEVVETPEVDESVQGVEGVTEDTSEETADSEELE